MSWCCHSVSDPADNSALKLTWQMETSDRGVSRELKPSSVSLKRELDLPSPLKRSVNHVTIRHSPASEWSVLVRQCLSACVYSAGWCTECVFPAAGSQWSARAALTPAGSEGLVVLAVMDCWRKTFNIRLTGIIDLKPDLGLQGWGNALKENGKKRTDPTDKAEPRRCVCWMFCHGTSQSSRDGCRCKENGLWNTNTKGVSEGIAKQPIRLH